jgi:hypothetical protein
MTDATKKTTVAMLKIMSSIEFQAPSIAFIYRLKSLFHLFHILSYFHRVEKRFIGTSPVAFDEAP